MVILTIRPIIFIPTHTNIRSYVGMKIIGLIVSITIYLILTKLRILFDDMMLVKWEHIMRVERRQT